MKLILAVGLATQTALVAAGGWDGVTQLAPGTRIEVIHNGMKRTQGAVGHIGPDAISIRAADQSGSTVTIAKKDIQRVSTLETSRGRRALLGLVIGAGAGAAVLAIGASAGDIDIRRDIVAGAGALAGGAVGAGVGAATAGPRTIYRAP